VSHTLGAGGFGPGVGTWHYNGHSWTKRTGVAAGIDTASALSASNIWAVGSSGNAPQDAIVHYNGKHWTRKSAAALKNSQLNAIHAVTRTNVWATGTAGGQADKPLLVHWNGKNWKKVPVPFKVSLGRFIPDGRGGLWIAAEAVQPKIVTWILHRSKSGTWTRTRIGAAPTTVADLARVPGTSAVWASGSKATRTPGSAVVYAHGSIG
jgi:hypothetical protein